MTSNIEKLQDHILCSLDCSYCKRGLTTLDYERMAEEAHNEGWRITKSFRVMCPTCSAKRKRKSAPKKKRN